MSGFQYTPENLQRLEKALQSMQERGMESDPRYAQLLSLMRAKPPSAEMSDVGHGLQLPPPSMSIGIGSMLPGTRTGDIQKRSSPAPSMMLLSSPKVHRFSSPQLLQLKAQIMAYNLLARNQSLPEHVRIAIQGKSPYVKSSGASSQSNQLSSRSQNQPRNQMAPQSQTPIGAGSSGASSALSVPNQTAYDVPGRTPDLLGQMFKNLQQIQCNARKINSNIDPLLELENIASGKGFVISNNEGSGNCMFHALSEQLNLVEGIKISHEELRQSIVQYLFDNPRLPNETDLFNFIDGYQSWADYLTDMRKDGTWGDHVILYATVNCYKTHIRVISSQSNHCELTIKPDGHVISTNPLVLGHVHEFHYVSLQPKQAPADPVPEGTVTGQVSGATRDRRHSTGVRGAQKRKTVKQVKEGTPTDDEIEELGIKIAKDWIKLGRRLEVSDPDIEEIDQARNRLSQKGYHMLKHWKQEKGSAATYQALCEALQHPFVQRKDLAEKFCYINVKPAGKRESSCSSNHPDAKRTRLAEAFNLGKCQHQLQSVYDTMNQVNMIPWNPGSTTHIDDIYTTLSWVRDDRKPSGVTQVELEEYTDLFNGDEHYPNPKRILVYGRPGIGKTTFSKKTAFDWSKQRKEILKKFDVALLIKLRDVCDLKDIRDVLRASKLLAGEEVVSVDDVYKYILDNQEKVLLILDGYDEYFCTGESPVLEIWKGARLTDIHVIITTRKEKADKLRAGKQVQFEINGFKTDDQVRAFVNKILTDEERVEEFVTYLDQRDLKDLAEIPLLLLMLCTVWKESHFEELPKSRAHICQNFVLTLIHHAISKNAKAEEKEDIDILGLYNVELCALGKLAFDALLQNALFFPFGKLTDSICFLSDKFIKFGLFHVLNAATFLRCKKHVYFIHKSVQEYLAAFFLKEELLKEESTSCLSEVHSFEKIVKMIEVLRFACELSADAACVVLSHLGIVGKKEGLTEYNFTEAPCIHDLPDNQYTFLTLISHSFFSCSAKKRRDLYPMFLSYVSGVLFIDSDQLHSLTNEHFLKSALAPEFIFFPSGLHTEQSYQDLISVLEDLSAVVVCCFGEKWKASDFLKKYSLSSVKVFLKKEEGKIYLYIGEIHTKKISTFPTEILTELISSPESTQKKPVDDQSNEQDDSSALCLTENSTDDTHHCLSFVWTILVRVYERQEIETLIDVLPFVTSPRGIYIYGRGRAPDPVLVDTLVSRINFTNRLHCLALSDINLTAKPAAVIARSLCQAPNLDILDLSWNPLGEGVSDLTRHLSCAPHLECLHLRDVKMTKKQVNDLTEAVRQIKIKDFWTSYHDKKGNLKPKYESDEEWYGLEDELEIKTSSESEDELGPGASSASEDEQGPVD